jgi:hypothetical protein
MAAAERWAALVETMLAKGAATYGSDGPQRAFGSTSLKTDGKIFAMLVKDRLVVKLDRRRVDELVEAGRAGGSIPATVGSRRNGSMSTPRPPTCGSRSRPRPRSSSPGAVRGRPLQVPEGVQQERDGRLTSGIRARYVSTSNAPGPRRVPRRNRKTV